MKDERPSLLFWADDDPALPLDPVGRAVQMLFPMAEPLTVIENAGHFLQEDHGGKSAARLPLGWTAPRFDPETGPCQPVRPEEMVRRVRLSAAAS